MTTHLYPEFILAVTALMLLPGPNVAVIVANSVSHGVRAGLLTVAGTASAMVIQLAITALGLDAVLRPTPWFTFLRWAGTVYLIYLGLRAWRTKPTGAAPASGPHIYRRGLVVSLTNPKTLLFYAAFFPQFITPAQNIPDQTALLAATFLAIALSIDSLWAFAAHRARRLLANRHTLTNRLSGTILIAAGVSLAFARAK